MPPVNSRGQSLIELSLILPIIFFFALLFLNWIDWGSAALRLQVQAAEAVRQTALRGRELHSWERIRPSRRFKADSGSSTYGFIVKRSLQITRPPKRLLSWILPILTFHCTAIYPAESPIERTDA